MIRLTTPDTQIVWVNSNLITCIIQRDAYSEIFFGNPLKGGLLVLDSASYILKVIESGKND